MITEDYVSFETAKLLKEKGFPQEYDVFHSMIYNEEDFEDEYEVQRMVLQTRLVKAGTLSSYPVGVPEPKCYCPTLQMAMKWLREIHHIHIVIKSVIRTYGDTEYYYELYGTKNKSLCVVCDIYKGETWSKSEQACEAAIKYSLTNLI